MNLIEGDVAILPAAELKALLGAANFTDAPEDKRFFSSDVYREADVQVLATISPGSIDELSAAVKLCTDAGLIVIPRGGGYSYTGGYLPERGGSVMVDMRRMNRILEINQEDMYVTVETGVVWKDLYETLRPLGLRTPYFGPMSGYSSVVGGALSQGSVFLGSTQYGVTAESVLGLSVVLADGEVLDTGSAGSLYSDNPFFRYYGPDLTGIFLGDTGAFGLKARATLKLIRTPPFQGFATFTFDNAIDFMDAATQVGREGLSAECYGSDPYIWDMRLWDEDFAKDVKRLVNVVKSGRTVLGGIKDAVRIAATGRRALKDVEYALNLAVDGYTEGEVDRNIARIDEICQAKGRKVEATAPRAVRATPFLPPNDLIGIKGHRWAPIHGIAPLSKAQDALAATLGVFEKHAEAIAEHGVEWGYVIFGVGNSGILIEPMIYWPGERKLYHERMIEPAHLAKLPVFDPNPGAAETVAKIRNDLTQAWMELGCTHLQIGKVYRYFESRKPAVRKMIEGIKALVDPRNQVNPGSLGLR